MKKNLKSFLLAALLMVGISCGTVAMAADTSTTSDAVAGPSGSVLYNDFKTNIATFSNVKKGATIAVTFTKEDLAVTGGITNASTLAYQFSTTSPGVNESLNGAEQISGSQTVTYTAVNDGTVYMSYKLKSSNGGAGSSLQNQWGFTSTITPEVTPEPSTTESESSTTEPSTTESESSTTEPSTTESESSTTEPSSDDKGKGSTDSSSVNKNKSAVVGNNGSNNGTPGQEGSYPTDKLPQTGSQYSSLFTALGALVAVVAGSVFFFQKRKFN